MAGIRSQVFLIADAGTVSSVVFRENIDLIGLVSPSDITVALHGCDTETGTFGQMQDTEGTDMSFDLKANQPRAIGIENTHQSRYFKLVASAAVSGDISIKPIFRDIG